MLLKTPLSCSFYKYQLLTEYNGQQERLLTTVKSKYLHCPLVVDCSTARNFHLKVSLVKTWAYVFSVMLGNVYGKIVVLLH